MMKHKLEPIDFPFLIAKIREVFGYTLPELAEVLGVSLRSINRWGSDDGVEPTGKVAVWIYQMGTEAIKRQKKEAQGKH